MVWEECDTFHGGIYTVTELSVIAFRKSDSEKRICQRRAEI